SLHLFHNHDVRTRPGIIVTMACLSVALLCFWLPLKTHGELTGNWEIFDDRCLYLMDHGRLLEGKTVAEEFVANAKEQYGEYHDTTATAMHWLAWFTQYTGDFTGAEKIWWRALAIDEKVHGENTVETARRLNMLGVFYREKGDFKRSQ